MTMSVFGSKVSPAIIRAVSAGDFATCSRASDMSATAPRRVAFVEVPSETMVMGVERAVRSVCGMLHRHVS